MDERTGRAAVGCRAEVAAFLRRHPHHYVYVLRKPDGVPFYVGKGLGDRVFHHETQARLTRRDAKLNTIRKIEREGGAITYEIDSLHASHEAALAREVALIAALGRLKDGGPLTNLTAGGEGVIDLGPESKARHQASLGGIPEDDPERATVNAFFLRLGQPRSICVKPARGFVIEPTVAYADRLGRAPTPRMAMALAVSAAATGRRLAPGVRLPRAFRIDGVPVVIENGVARDIATARLAAIEPCPSPWDEVFGLDDAQSRYVLNQVAPMIVEEFRLL